jgi:hypothetical protein
VHLADFRLPHDGHPAAEGHQRIADELGPFLHTWLGDDPSDVGSVTMAEAHSRESGRFGLAGKRE